MVKFKPAASLAIVPHDPSGEDSYRACVGWNGVLESQWFVM